MGGDRDNWKSIDEVGLHMVPLFSLIYTEVSQGHPTRVRVVLRTADGPIELFRAPADVLLDIGGATVALAVLPERWFQGMENAVAKYHALRALKEPL